MSKPGPKGSRRTRDQRLMEVSHLYLQGRWQSEIAEIVGTSQAQVCQDLAELQKRWQAGQLRNYEKAVAEELAKIDYLEREYWGAWDASRKSQEGIGTGSAGTAGAAQMQKRARRGQGANPAFLAGV